MKSVLKFNRTIMGVFFFALFLLKNSHAQTSATQPDLAPLSQGEGVPAELKGIEIEPKIGTQVPLNLVFQDQDGKTVTLQDYFTSNRPIILTLNYYKCPMLCGLVLTGLQEGLKSSDLQFDVGKDFQIVTVSIDHREKPDLAKQKQEVHLLDLKEHYQSQHKAVPESAWSFLTGTPTSIQFLADTLGFHYRYDAATNQIAHSAGIYILTPSGKVSQILYGAEFKGKTLRLALIEASEGKLGSISDRILLWCYHYDPEVRKYTAAAWKIMRIAGVLTVIGLLIFLGTLWRNEKRKRVVNHA